MPHLVTVIGHQPHTLNGRNRRVHVAQAVFSNPKNQKEA